MKTVWIIEQFDAEPYESTMDGVHSVYLSREKAFAFFNRNRGVLGQDSDGLYGYILREPYEIALMDGDG